MAYTKLQTERALEVTPNDSTNISLAGDVATNRGCVLYVGVGGSLKVMTAGGDTVTFKNFIGGSFLPVQVLRVYSTGTTASEIIAMW